MVPGRSLNVLVLHYTVCHGFLGITAKAADENGKKTLAARLGEFSITFWVSTDGLSFIQSKQDDFMLPWFGIEQILVNPRRFPLYYRWCFGKEGTPRAVDYVAENKPGDKNSNGIVETDEDSHAEEWRNTKSPCKTCGAALKTVKKRKRTRDTSEPFCDASCRKTYEKLMRATLQVEQDALWSRLKHQGCGPSSAPGQPVVIIDLDGDDTKASASDTPTAKRSYPGKSRLKLTGADGNGSDGDLEFDDSDPLVDPSNANGTGRARARKSKAENLRETLTPEEQREVAEKKKAKFEEAKESLTKRIFYHAVTSAPIDPEDLFVDSDDDVDETWRLNMENDLLDEFTDVHPKEKVFMKLWNTFLFHRNGIYSDKRVPEACEEFARKYGPKIKELNLRAEALMHLVTLWDFGLIDSVGITKVMGIFDKAVVGNS